MSTSQHPESVEEKYYRTKSKWVRNKLVAYILVRVMVFILSDNVNFDKVHHKHDELHRNPQNQKQVIIR